MKKKPPKLGSDELLKRIRKAVEEGEYWDTRHASARKVERGIVRPEVEQVLRAGWHEARKDEQDGQRQESTGCFSG